MLVLGYTFFDENSTSTQSESVANIKLLSQFTVQVELIDQSADISLHVLGVSTLSLPEDYFEIIGVNNTTYKTVSVITSPGIYTFPISGVQKIRMVSDSPVGGFKVVGNIANSDAKATPIVPTGNINITTTNTVDVTKYATAKVVDSNLKASNIAKGVNILGITGSYEGGITPSGTYKINQNGVYDITDYANVNVAVPQSSQIVNRIKAGVNFVNRFGNVIEVWTPEEISSKTNLPAIPNDGSISWNWTISEIKQYASTYPKSAITVGTFVEAPNSNTWLYISVKEGRMSPSISFAVNGSATIDWGDQTTTSVTGSSLSTLITQKHTYAEPGVYFIEIQCSDEMAFIGSSTYGSTIVWANSQSSLANRVYQNSLLYVYIGDAVTSISAYAFAQCGSLMNIFIHDGIESIDTNAFLKCMSLEYMTWPRITSIPTNAFNGCGMLQSISVSPTVLSIGQTAFVDCSSMLDVVIPIGSTTIGTGAFSRCYALKYIAVPSTVTTIGESAFYKCVAISQIDFDASIVDINQYTFNICTSLSVFNNASNYRTMNTDAFNECVSLSSFIIPSSTVTIERGVFVNCSGLGFIKFEGTTPPAVTNSAVWTGVPKDCKILVPAGTLSSYTSATNYPSSSEYTYEEY